MLLSPEIHMRLIVERAVKTLQVFGMLPLVGVAILVLALSALVLGYLGRPRAHGLAAAGLVSGSAAFGLLVLSVTLSFLQGRLWLLGFAFYSGRW
jgi:hypothetical protein